MVRTRMIHLLALAALAPCADRRDNLGVLGGHAREGAARQRHQRRIRADDDRCRPGHVVEQGELAEELALVDFVQHGGVPRAIDPLDAQQTEHHQVERIARIALGDDDLAAAGFQGHARFGQHAQVARGQPPEQRRVAQAGDAFGNRDGGGHARHAAQAVTEPPSRPSPNAWRYFRTA